jgi:hypothetical protein
LKGTVAKADSLHAAREIDRLMMYCGHKVRSPR